MFEKFKKLIRGTPSQSVELECNCGTKQPIWNLFFCYKANELVCEQCSIKEIDTYFSPSLLISTLSNSAFEDFNRCNKECDCPICGSTLRHFVEKDNKNRLICEFCRWDSSEVGLITAEPAQLTEMVRKKEFPHAEEFKAALERLIKENELEEGSLFDSEAKIPMPEDEEAGNGTGIGAMRETLKALDYRTEFNRRALYKLPEKVERKIEPLEDPLEEDTNSYDLTTIGQRMIYPGIQPKYVDKLYPRRKALMTKIAHRCPTSRKYVVKPKIGASHISFDVCNLAIQVLPKITVDLPESMAYGSKASVFVLFKNPIPSPVNLKLSKVETKKPQGEETKTGTDPVKTGTDPVKTGTDPVKTVTDPKLTDESKTHTKREGALVGDKKETEIEIKAPEVEIPPYDEITEDIMQLKPSGGAEKAKNGIVSFGKSGKIGVQVDILPEKGGTDEIFFKLQVTITPKLSKDTPSKITFKEFTFTVHFNLGKIET
ncbi:hypothetical protein AAMO2058_001129600 [Amorphochlora amoebiformis]